MSIAEARKLPGDMKKPTNQQLEALAEILQLADGPAPTERVGMLVREHLEELSEMFIRISEGYEED